MPAFLYPFFFRSSKKLPTTPRHSESIFRDLNLKTNSSSIEKLVSGYRKLVKDYKNAQFILVVVLVSDSGSLEAIEGHIALFVLLMEYSTFGGHMMKEELDSVVLLVHLDYNGFYISSV